MSGSQARAGTIRERCRQRAFKLPYNKRRRFTQKELELDKFIERQLNDTRYISRAALEYLRALVCRAAPRALSQREARPGPFAGCGD